MQKEHLQTIKRSIILSAISILILAIGIALYINKINHSLKNDLSSYIEELSNREALTFSQEIKIEQQALGSMAAAIGEYDDLTNITRLLTLLDFENSRNDFKQMGVIMPGNRIYFNDQTTSENFIPKINILEAWGGQRQLVGDISDPNDKEKIIIHIYPVYKNGKVKALLFATQRSDYYSKLLSKGAFWKQGTLYVVKRSGRIVIGPKNAPTGNIYELNTNTLIKNTSIEAIKERIAAGQTGVIQYILNDTQKLLGYVPLEFNEWYLLFAIPSQVITKKAMILLQISLILCLTMFTVFTGLVLYIVRIQKQNKKKLSDLAFIDPLTDSPNLNKFRIDAPKIIQENPHKDFAIISMDINKFKVVNELYGQRQGDMVLVHTANIIKEYIGHNDIYARVGSDIFIILVSYKKEADITDKIKKIEKGIKNCYATTDKSFVLSASFGIYKVNEDLPFYSLIDRANIAKTAAKNGDGKLYEFYEDTARKQILSQKNIEDNMATALNDMQFTLFYQPKYDFKTSKITEAEALVRWNHPKKGVISPDEFIPLFEKNGFIVKLDMFVLEETAKKIRQWLDKGIKPVPVSINFSRLHLNNPNYLADFKKIADKYKIPPHLIELELTESAVFSNIGKIKSFITALHALGFSIAMDDFGAGYSSLNVLKNLPFDTLKLDKEFLKDSDHNNRARTIVEGTVKMLKTLKAKIVAEGIETQNQADFLNSIGCDLAQGYLFSKPLPPLEFEILLKNIKN